MPYPVFLPTMLRGIIVVATVVGHMTLLGVWFAFGPSNQLLRLAVCSGALLVLCATAFKVDALPLGEYYCRFLTLFLMVGVPLQFLRCFTTQFDDVPQAGTKIDHDAPSNRGSASRFRWSIKNLLGATASVAIITGIFVWQIDIHSRRYAQFSAFFAPFLAVVVWTALFFVWSDRVPVRALCGIAILLCGVLLVVWLRNNRYLFETSVGTGVFLAWLLFGLIFSRPRRHGEFCHRRRADRIDVGEDNVQEDASNRVVASVVRVFDVVIKPVVRVVRAVVLAPELAAVGSVAEKRFVKRHNVDVVAFRTNPVDDFVVGRVDR